MAETGWYPLLKSYPFSEKVNSVSIGAEVLFCRLLAQADDFGNYYGDPRMILATLFPHRWAKHEVTETDVAHWRNELVTPPSRARNGDGTCTVRALAVTYTVDGVEYLHILNPRRRFRTDVKQKARFPREPEDIDRDENSGDVTDTYRARTADVPLELEQELEQELEKPCARVPRKGKAEKLADDFSAWWSGEDGEPAYPRRVNRKKSEEKYIAARKNGATKEELAIGKRHYAQACRLEATEERFIAHAATWLGQERWKDYQQPPKPVDRKPTNGDRTSTDEAADEMVSQYRRCVSAAQCAATEIDLESKRDVLAQEDRQKIADLQAAQQRHEERAADIKARLEARGVIVDEKERVR